MPETKRNAAADAAEGVEVKAEERAAESAVEDDGDVLDEDIYQDCLHVPRPGSMELAEGRYVEISEEHWAQAVELLSNGYVVGLPATKDEAPDVACNLAQRCRSFAITGRIDPAGNDLIFFVRIDNGETVPPRRWKSPPKRHPLPPGTALEVH